MTYTVDEVSDLMGVPRPTLYRYLREYSIPHLRRSGKIYVPEDSFDRIKEVRELHKEGLGTESVRKRLQGESGLDAEGLTERLDRISESLEELRRNPKPANGTSSAQVLQTILERQSLLISAVFNLTEMLEDLLHTSDNGQARKEASGTSEEETQEQEPLSDSFEKRPEKIENEEASPDGPVTAASVMPAVSPSAPVRHRKFGAMAKRRRRVAALAVLLALLTSAALVAVYVSNEEGSEASSQAEAPEPPLEAPISSEEIAAESSDAAPSAPAGREEEPVGYGEQDYEIVAPQQPLHQTQYAAPVSPPQEQPVLQPQLLQP